MITVKFLRGHSPYNAGEVAGFEDEMAEKLIREGAAAPLESPQADEPDGAEKANTVPTAATKPKGGKKGGGQNASGSPSTQLSADGGQAPAGEGNTIGSGGADSLPSGTASAPGQDGAGL